MQNMNIIENLNDTYFSKILPISYVSLFFYNNVKPTLFQ